MATDRPRDTRTIDRLVADLAPVRARRVWHDVALLGAVMGLEFALILGLMPTRADLGAAIEGPMLWWKLLGSAGIAGAAAAALLALASPAAHPGAGRRWMVASAALAVLVGAALWLAGAMPVALIRTLDWREGLMCVGVVELYAAPVWLAAFVVARRGAPARPRAAAAAAGLLGAAWGGAAFALWCPHDDPLYVVTWYGIAMLIGLGTGALLLTRGLRW